MLRNNAEKMPSYENGKLNEEDFINLPMWFDEDEESTTLPSNIYK